MHTSNETMKQCNNATMQQCNRKTVQQKNRKTEKQGVNSEGSLGILTKVSSTLEQQGLEGMAVRRAVKYSLQNEAVKLLPTERVRFCLRHRIDGLKGVEVRYNENREKAHYSNVQRCGSVWVCPICSA